MPSGDPYGIPIDHPTRDTSQMSIINPPSVTSENLTKYPFHVPKELTSENPIKVHIQYPGGYPTGDTSTMTTELTSIEPNIGPGDVLF